MKKMKKMKKSPLTIALYVFAVLLFIYAIYMVGTTVAYLGSYFSSYGQSFAANIGTAIGYILTQSLVYFVYAVLVFVAAKTYDMVLAMNCKACAAPAEEAAEAAEVVVETAEDTVAEAVQPEEIEAIVDDAMGTAEEAAEASVETVEDAAEEVKDEE